MKVEPGASGNSSLHYPDLNARFKIALIVLTAGLFTWVLQSSFKPAQTIDTNAKIKAMFIYSFTRYVEWPSDYKQGNFVIGVMGSGSLVSELDKMANSGKRAGSQAIEVKSFATSSAISRCHMLIVPSDFKGNLAEVLAKIKGQSTLIITEKAGMAKSGAAINFVVQNNKQAFELNKSNAEKYDLKVSSNLLTLAIVVE